MTIKGVEMATIEQVNFDKSTIEELYTYYPVPIDDWRHPDGIHSASTSTDPTSPLFIAARNRSLPNPIVDPEVRSSWPGFDFLNGAAHRQYWSWNLNMLQNNSWYDSRSYPTHPVDRSSMSLAQYFLSFWSHAIQDSELTISAHATNTMEGKKQRFTRGFVLLNKHVYGRLNHLDPSEELRDVVPLLQSAFEIPASEIASNVGQPFPHRNLWAIPGGKMIAIPEKYDDERAGVVSLRLIPTKHEDL